MNLDILAFGAHPDDVELSCGGTILKHISLGKTAGIIDLTQGELGSRGTAQIRLKEAAEAAKILKVTERVNLGFADGFFKNDEKHQLEVIRVLRKYRPKVVLANAINDRHPDHGKAAQLIKDACFLSGLEKIETELNGKKQEKWRPSAVYHYIQAYNLQPDIVVDISDFIEKKMESVKAYRSQFYDPQSNEPDTFISSPEFMQSIYSKALLLGQHIGAKYGEGFTVNRYIGIKDFTDLL